MKAGRAVGEHVGFSEPFVARIGAVLEMVAAMSKASIAAGATRQEIAETVSVCVMMGGGPAYMYGVKALEAYDQLSA